VSTPELCAVCPSPSLLGAKAAANAMPLTCTICLLPLSPPTLTQVQETEKKGMRSLLARRAAGAKMLSMDEMPVLVAEQQSTSGNRRYVASARFANARRVDATTAILQRFAPDRLPYSFELVRIKRRRSSAPPSSAESSVVTNDLDATLDSEAEEEDLFEELPAPVPGATAMPTSRPALRPRTRSELLSRLQLVAGDAAVPRRNTISSTIIPSTSGPPRHLSINLPKDSKVRGAKVANAGTSAQHARRAAR